MRAQPPAVQAMLERTAREWCLVSEDAPLPAPGTVATLPARSKRSPHDAADAQGVALPVD
jgi:hypothetical protein